MIDQYEYTHGAVLMRLLANLNEIHIHPITTRDNMRAAYWVNEKAIFYIKHSLVSKAGRADWKSWTFTFRPEHLLDLADLYNETRRLYMVLVCGSRSLRKETGICLLMADELSGFLDFTAYEDQQWIRVRMKKGHSFRVISELQSEPVTVARNRLDKLSL